MYNPDVKRAGRYILNCVTVLSLVLCLATVALWVQSWLVDASLYHSGDNDVSLRSSAGEFAIQINKLLNPEEWIGMARGWYMLPVHRPSTPIASRLGSGPTLWNRLGFAGFHGSTSGPGVPRFDIRMIVIPYWPLVIVCALLPIRSAIRWTPRKRRIKRGLCPACGYDLRATPERCPECGSTAERSSARSPASPAS
jgi:hypothetical protein